MKKQSSGTKMNRNDCIVGLGYVGLPLAVEFGKNMPTNGYDYTMPAVKHKQLWDIRDLDYVI